MRFLFIKVRGSVKDLVHSLEAMGHEVTTLEGYEFEPYAARRLTALLRPW